MWLTWANALTALRLALIAPLVLAVIHGVWTVAAGLFTLAVLTDYFDGPLARHHGQATPIGGFMDHATDALFVTVLCAAMALHHHLAWLLPVLIPLAFIQYSVDSRVLAGRALRPNRLGRVNGISYYVLPGVVIGAHWLDWWGWLAMPTSIASWLLCTSTLVSMGLRATNYRATAD
ncbi:MAG: CDP-alcohol phosphatidyltransferase family protein [Pseudomonadales bacterium]|nr:CDP-alcohol phosphatidyltransferase family protein [Pseudomonadales bacterium]MCP5184081.1 CDP-alcohol phosphatidyltransferase family protein [Pseudomonadales bacterium]